MIIKEIIPFEYNGHPIRIVKDDKGEPWLVAREICDVLDYAIVKAWNLPPSEHVQRLVPSLEGPQAMTLINLFGFRRLTFWETRPEAVKFTKWVMWKMDGWAPPEDDPVNEWRAQPGMRVLGSTTGRMPAGETPISRDVVLPASGLMFGHSASYIITDEVVTPKAKEKEQQTMESGREVVTFDYNGQPIRVVKDDKGEPWFVAGDVCKVLGYANPSRTVGDHCKYAKLLRPTEKVGLEINPRGEYIIPESDLYRLTMRSKLTRAQFFQDWIVEEVLPSIRKHGGYIAGQEKLTNEQLLANAVLVAQSVIAEKDKLLAEQQARIAVQEYSLAQAQELTTRQNEILTEQAPKVEGFDGFISEDGLCSIEAAVHQMGCSVGAPTVCKFLRGDGKS